MNFRCGGYFAHAVCAALRMAVVVVWLLLANSLASSSSTEKRFCPPGKRHHLASHRSEFGFHRFAVSCQFVAIGK